MMCRLQLHPPAHSPRAPPPTTPSPVPPPAGTFRLDGIPSAPRGVPQIEVRFDIDANGILSVTATDKGSGKAQDIKITGASTLPSDEVDRMVQDAEKNADGQCAAAAMLCCEGVRGGGQAVVVVVVVVCWGGTNANQPARESGPRSSSRMHAHSQLPRPRCPSLATAEDRKARELIDAKNQADSLVYQTEKQLAEFGDKVPSDVKDKVQAKATALKEAIPSDDVDKVRLCVRVAAGLASPVPAVCLLVCSQPACTGGWKPELLHLPCPHSH